MKNDEEFHISAEHPNEFFDLEREIMKTMSKEEFGNSENDGLEKWIRKYGRKLRNIIDRRIETDMEFLDKIKKPDQKSKLIEEIIVKLKPDFYDDIRKAA